MTPSDFVNKLSTITGVPNSLEDQLFSTMRSKLPAEVDDSIIYDILKTNLQIVKDHFQSVS